MGAWSASITFKFLSARRRTRRRNDFALSNRAVGRQIAHYLFDETGEFRQAAVPIRVLKQKTTLKGDFQHPLLHLSQVRRGIGVGSKQVDDENRKVFQFLFRQQIQQRFDWSVVE